jgi:hypothetical protein
MRWRLWGWAAAAVLASAGLALAGEGDKAKRPQLGLRASPRVSFSPIEVLVTGQLKGGAELEELYCPGLEWDWGDGTRSAHESDCEPWGADAAFERFFSARHAYRSPGAYNVRLTLRRANRTLAVATVAVTVHGRAANADQELSDY